MERESPLIYIYIRFQLGNSFGNIYIYTYISGKGKSTYIHLIPLIYSFSIRKFIWEYISGKGKSTYIFVFN